ITRASLRLSRTRGVSLRGRPSFIRFPFVAPRRRLELRRGKAAAPRRLFARRYESLRTVCVRARALAALTTGAVPAGANVTAAGRAMAKRGAREEALGESEDEHRRQDARGTGESEKLRSDRGHTLLSHVSAFLK